MSPPVRSWNVPSLPVAAGGMGLIVGTALGILAGSSGGFLTDGDRASPQVTSPHGSPAEERANETPPWEWKALAPVTAVKPPHRVILIGIDTLRADHLSSYGYQRKTSPNLDRLASKEGVRFERVYASSSWTLPSMTSTFTSLHPPQHLVEERETRLDPGIPTLAGAFHFQGWLTSGFVTHIYISSLFGLDYGFDEWRELSIDWNFREGKQLRADSLNSYVLPWLSHHRDKRFFLYVHFFDPHWNYAPPTPYDQEFIDPDYDGTANGTFRYMRSFLRKDQLLSPPDLQRVVDLYDGEILWTDHQIGLLFDHLKKLGIWDDSLLMVIADHGEEFQEHRSFGHTRTLYEEVLPATATNRHGAMFLGPSSGPRASRRPEMVTSRCEEI